MADDYMLDKVLDMIKEIKGIEKIENTKILIDANSELADDTTLKNFAVLITCVIKDDGKFYSKLFLEEALFLKQTW